MHSAPPRSSAGSEHEGRRGSHASVRLSENNAVAPPYEYTCKIWISEPHRFILNPIHQMPGLNT
ncbi:hypothetical protein ESD82_01780 [Paracoccus pantotrophus]|uniref:Uncharacterized protein n=1 Tax=Paracoccus pantotrophus TaxID=82367 RepID=A0AAE6NTT9_PARPN|nr:hypothetical protein ESD82_01780 [Paracoccus pantotrophus]